MPQVLEENQDRRPNVPVTSRVARSQRRAFERHDELNALYVSRVKASIVGNEEIDARGRRTCQLDRVGGPQGAITPELSVDPCRLRIKGKQQSGAGDGVLVLPCQFFISPLDGFDEHLTERQRGRQELVTPCKHRSP